MSHASFKQSKMTPSTQAISIRQMLDGEHFAVADILQYYASREVLLWRTPEDILEHAGSFLVACCDEHIIGCIAWHDYGNQLYEIRSLAVVESFTGRGIGKHLVRAALDEVRQRHAERVFVLTRKRDFFRTSGFREVPKDQFPQKVWKDCNLCRKRDNCDEIAMTLSDW